MRCKILAIVIILIIFAIIGMISIKIIQDDKHTNEHVKIENFEEQMSIELGNTISDNAKKTNDLLTDLSTANMNVIKPNFELQNVNTDGI